MRGRRLHPGARRPRSGREPDVVTTLRRIAERVFFSAALAAKSCAVGQQRIGKALQTPDQVAAGIPPAPTVPMQPVRPPAAPSMPVQTAEKPKYNWKAKSPEKDKLLVNAFADAIKQATAQQG